MQEILLNASQKSVIHCGEGAFERYAPALSRQKIFIVTDSNVFALYRETIWRTFGDFVPVYILPAGERSKTVRYLTEIFKKMHECGVQRSWRMIALGGGVVGDIAGLAASLYMRGMKLTQIPTTLLSQVDSSVGGKTAVDFENVKNLIGTFYQPEEVIVDPMFLKTLPAREVRCGLGEIVKYGALSHTIFQSLLKNSANLTDLGFLGGITADCIRHKAEVVHADERDSGGVRKSLNLGHTTGHAFELYYKKRSHGEFVLTGMYYELYIAVKRGICGGGYAKDIKMLVENALGKIPFYDDIERAAQGAKYDKKNDGKGISLIVPETEGKWAELTLNMDEYVALLAECRDLGGSWKL